MRTPDLTEIIDNLSERLDALETADTEFGDSAGPNYEVPIILNFTGSVDYYADPITHTPFAKITWSWDEPLMHDEDGNIVTADMPTVADDFNIDPVVDYGFGTSTNGAPVVYSSSKGSTVVVTDKHALNTPVTGYVYAITRSRIIGPTISVTVTVGKDTVAPPKPNAPVITAHLGQLIVRDNNLTSTGTAMPVDTAYKSVEISLNTTTWLAVGRISGAGTFPLPSLPYDVRHYVRLIAYDYSGNASIPSDVRDGVPRKLVDADIEDGAIKAWHIAANQIQANHLEAVLIIGNDIYAGDPGGSNVQLNMNGLYRNVFDPDEGGVVESFHIGGEDGDWLAFRNTDQQVVASIDDAGNAAFTSVETESLLIKGQSVDELVNDMPRGIKGWVNWTSNSASLSTTGSESAYVEFRATLEKDRMYEIKIGSHLVDASEAGPVLHGQVRVAYDGTSVTTSSPLLVAPPTKRIASNAAQGSSSVYTAILSTAGQVGAVREARFLYTVQKSAGTGSTQAIADSTRPIVCTVTDIGAAIPQTAAITTRKTTWESDASMPVGGFGFMRSDSTYYDYSNMPMTVGNCYNGMNWSQITFSNSVISGENVSVATAMSGSPSIVKAEVYLYCQYSQNNSVSIQVRANTLTGLSETPSPSGSYVAASFPEGTGKWVDITSVWTVSSRGIWISGNSTGTAGHGHFRSPEGYPGETTAPKLRLTYRK